MYSLLKCMLNANWPGNVWCHRYCSHSRFARKSNLCVPDISNFPLLSQSQMVWERNLICAQANDNTLPCMLMKSKSFALLEIQWVWRFFSVLNLDQHYREESKRYISMFIPLFQSHVGCEFYNITLYNSSIRNAQMGFLTEFESIGYSRVSPIQDQILIERKKLKSNPITVSALLKQTFRARKRIKNRAHKKGREKVVRARYPAKVSCSSSGTRLQYGKSSAEYCLLLCNPFYFVGPKWLYN